MSDLDALLSAVHTIPARERTQDRTTWRRICPHCGAGFRTTAIDGSSAGLDKHEERCRAEDDAARAHYVAKRRWPAERPHRTQYVQDIETCRGCGLERPKRFLKPDGEGFACADGCEPKTHRAATVGAGTTIGTKPRVG